MIDARTFLLGVIGHPLGHTLSPALHNAALAHAGLNGVYLALDTAPAALGPAIAAMRAWRIRGLNVTLPHKVAVLELLDGLTVCAEAVGAVNTVYWEGDRLMGDNTDVAGFRAQAVGLVGPEVRAAVLGMGGAARAVLYVLAEAGVREVTIYRRASGADPFLEAWAARYPATRWRTRAWEERDAASPAELLIQTTPLGMAPDPGESPLEAEQLARFGPATVLDLVYAPAQTRLLAMAEEQGRPVRGGRIMFLAQASEAFWRFTGWRVPEEVWQRALAEAETVGV